MINIEVIYATEKYVETIMLSLDYGATISTAIDTSGIIKKHPEIVMSKNKVGIYSKLCDLDTVLKDGDRVEIYRPLKADPKEARRSRALSQKTVQN